MRSDPLVFSAENEAQTKRPRFVISIEYDVESIYLSSHPGITGIPGVHIENVLRRPSAISQRIVPDEGRSEIGSMTFSLVDLNRGFTDEIREKLGDGKGLRGKKVRLYVGYEHPFEFEGGGFGTWGETFGYGTGSSYSARFNEFQLFQTQIIIDASYEDGIYEIRCADITREQRQAIFEPKTTTLRDTITADATTVPVYSTTGFQPVDHGPSYSDGPNAKVGYIKIDKEWVRYTATTVDSFTGCTRGVLNTKAVEHTVDAGSDADRRPKVEEGIYLELPAVKLAYAINTGIIYGTSPSETLPPHWHLGIDPDLVRLSDFTGIGEDLWDTALDTSGFVVRFQGLSKTDGKKFLESELYMPLGCYSPVYSDGTIGLKRMNQVLANSAYVVELNDQNVISHGALNHEFSTMHNRLQIDWNWNGERFTRSTLFIDSDSISAHGASPLKKLQFKGLHGSRHTEAIIRKRLDAFRDRYTSPPETTVVDVLSSLNKYEVGDVIRDRMQNVRDFAGTTQNIDRSFEIQRRSLDFASGDVTFELFGSTAPASENAPNDTGGGAALPDAYYGATGTDLTTVTTINVVGGVGVIQAGTYDLPDGVYYYLGDLELANGATLTINGTVQINVRGFFTINGAIDGVGRGRAGQADAAGWGTTQAGLTGFIGNTRGMDGIAALPRSFPVVFSFFQTVACALTAGRFSSFPFIELQVVGNDLLGVPDDMAGTSGGAGGKLGHSPDGFATGTVTSAGGSGADSGAGLAIIARGVALGASGEIDLSGDAAAATSTVANPFSIGGGNLAYPGAGASGGPGALFIALDGSGHFIPDLGGKFFAVTGAVPVNGTPMPSRNGFLQNLLEQGWAAPLAGFLDPSLISQVDLSNVAYRIQYIPQEETPQEDQELKPPAPTALAVEPAERINSVRVTLGGPLAANDFVEVFASITNNRPDAVRFAFGAGTEFTHEISGGTGLRYYWCRVRREIDGPDVFSDWFPSSATAGIASVALDFRGELPGSTGVFLDTFEHQDYARFYNLRAGTPTVTYPADGETGGRVIQFDDFGWIAWKQNIPYDPAALYVMTVRARMTVAPSDSSKDLFWAGVEGVGADGATLINASGANSSASQHYFVASGFDFGSVSVGTWTTFRGYISGHDATPDPLPAPDINDPAEAYSSGATIVKFIRPVLVLNYDGGDGVMQVDYIRIDRVVVTNGIGPNAATEVFSTSDAGPLTVTLTAPATQTANQQVKFVTVTLTEEATVEVTANYRAGINTAGTFEMYSFLYRSIGAAIVASTERIYKTGTVYEPFAGIATFVASAGTYRFGIGCTIQLGNGVNNVDAIFRDINLRVTVVKR